MRAGPRFARRRRCLVVPAGLAELYHLGVATHRQALVAALRPPADMGIDWPELSRLGALVAGGNARRIYPGWPPNPAGPRLG